MYAIKTIALAVAAFSLSGLAMPTESKKDLYVRGGVTEAQCGNGQVVSCCDTKKTNVGSDNPQGGLLGLGSALDGLLGGNCVPAPLDILAIAVPINKACGNNVAACCTGDQNGGLLNLQCNSLNVL